MISFQSLKSWHKLEKIPVPWGCQHSQANKAHPLTTGTADNRTALIVLTAVSLASLLLVSIFTFAYFLLGKWLHFRATLPLSYVSRVVFSYNCLGKWEEVFPVLLQFPLLRGESVKSVQSHLISSLGAIRGEHPPRNVKHGFAEKRGFPTLPKLP